MGLFKKGESKSWFKENSEILTTLATIISVIVILMFYQQNYFEQLVDSKLETVNEKIKGLRIELKADIKGGLRLKS